MICQLGQRLPIGVHAHAIRIVILGIGLMVCAGCTLGTVRDLRLIDLSKSAFDDAPGHFPGAKKQPDTMIVRVRVSTKKDIGRAVFEHHYFARARFFSCEKEDEDEDFESWAGVYYDDIRLGGDGNRNWYGSYSAIISKATPGAPFIYAIYFFPKAGPRRDNQTQSMLPPYDLEANSKAVCLQIMAVAMFGVPPGFHTNVVKIPKESVARILRDH